MLNCLRFTPSDNFELQQEISQWVLNCVTQTENSSHEQCFQHKWVSSGTERPKPTTKRPKINLKAFKYYFSLFLKGSSPGWEGYIKTSSFDWLAKDVIFYYLLTLEHYY